MSLTETASDASEPFAACAAYRGVARAITAIRAAGARTPDLATLAESVGMRPLTLQRTFSAWAGVSPKRFAQVLAAARARVALGGGQAVLGAALDAGLSGPGRLHDLMVTVEACTPGDVRARGRGLTFAWGVGPTRFGEAFVAMTARGVHRLAFVEGAEEVARELAGLAQAWPQAAVREDARAARECLARAFAEQPGRVPFHLWIRGTNLQIAVWRALLRLPAGALSTYSGVARQIGTPRAVRAVAGAVARNPVAWVIPCHRVLRSDGDLAGYAWGLDRKTALVGWEGVRAEAARARPCSSGR